MPSQSHRYPGHLQSSGPNFPPAGRYVPYKLPPITAAHSKVQIEKFQAIKKKKPPETANKLVWTRTHALTQTLSLMPFIFSQLNAGRFSFDLQAGFYFALLLVNRLAQMARVLTG